MNNKKNIQIKPFEIPQDPGPVSNEGEEAELTVSDEAREDEERAREEEQEQWSTDPEGEPEA